MTTPSSIEPLAIVVVLLVLFMARRAYQMVRGAPVRPARLFAFAAFYVVIFAATLAAASIGTPWYLYAADAGIVVASSILATSYIRRHVHLERRPPDHAWHYRLRAWVPLTYLALFVVRIGVAFWVLGPSALSFAPAPPVALSFAQELLLWMVDALFAVSTGLLVGRSVGVWLEYRAVIERERSSRSEPLPSGARP